MCQTVGELEREIEITVVHEVAYFLGIEEERREELGYGEPFDPIRRGRERREVTG